MKVIFTKKALALIAIIILPAGAQSQISTEGQDPLTEEHLQLILGDSTSLTDLSLPDGEVVTERWYRGTDDESFFGFFHVKVVVSSENDDELIAQHDWVIRYRGEIMQGRLQTTSKRDECYIMQSFEGIWKHRIGDGIKVIKLSLFVEPAPPSDSLPYVIRERKCRRNPIGIPENTMMLFLLAEKVRELPFDQNDVFTFNHFFPFEMEIGRNAAVHYVGPEEVTVDERQVRLHKFVCDGQDIKTIYLMVDDSQELIEITDGKNIEIILTTKQEVIDNWDF